MSLKQILHSTALYSEIQTMKDLKNMLYIMLFTGLLGAVLTAYLIAYH